MPKENFRPEDKQPDPPVSPATTGQASDGPATDDRVNGLMEPGEQIVAVLLGDGADLVVTSHRVVIVRQQVFHRPRSNVRTWAYPETSDLSYS